MAKKTTLDKSDERILKLTDMQMERLGQKVGVSGAGTFRERYDEITERLRDVVRRGLPTKDLAEFAIKRLGKTMYDASSAAALYDDDVSVDDDYIEASRYVFRYLEKYFVIVNSLLMFSEELQELQPYFNEELKKPEYGGKTLTELYNDKDDTLFNAALNNARDAKGHSFGAITIVPTDILELPVDKVNSRIWNLLKEVPKDGQIAFDVARQGSKISIPTYYSISFDDIENVQISKKLTPFDRRVYNAMSTLFNAGNEYITLTQIHYAMGNITRPSQRNLEKINEAITKMSAARIYVNNTVEQNVYKQVDCNYDGSLLPMERGTAVVNGHLTQAVIHIFREPPLVSIARKRKQITTVSLKVLQSPISKTPANLAIEDYLLEIISRNKHSGVHRFKLTYKTIFERTNIIEKKQKQRAPEKIMSYLKYYAECGLIVNGKESKEKDGVEIFL